MSGGGDRPSDSFKTRLLWPDVRTGPWDITLTWRLMSDRYECVGIEVVEALQLEPLPPGATADAPYRSKPPHKVLTAQRIRGLEWGRIMKTARKQLVREARYLAPVLRMQQDTAAGHEVEARSAGMQGRAGRRGRPQVRPDSHYEKVATLYVGACDSGDPPTKFVAEHFGVPHSTAAKWVRRCRKLGYLGEAQGRGKAGSKWDEEGATA